MKRRLGAVVLAVAAIGTLGGASSGAAAGSGPTEGFCQVTDPSYGYPGHENPTFVTSLQVIETAQSVVLRCEGPLSANFNGDTRAVGNPSGAAVYTGFPCLLAVGWLQQGHPPGPLPETTDSRQVTSASGETTLICVFQKPVDGF